MTVDAAPIDRDRTAQTTPADVLDIFVGGGADDWPVADLGVMRAFAAVHAARTGRPVRYLPNARVAGIVATIRATAPTTIINLIGHSYGGPDAWRAAALAAAAGRPVQTLITLDAVSGPLALLAHRFGRPSVRRFPGRWLDVQANPQRSLFSNRLPHLAPFAAKPAKLPFHQADHCCQVGADHADVEAMMRLAGADAWLELDPG